MDKETTEILEIEDFLSIKYIKWEFKRFNIITGDMGSGKSLCIKLTQFFEEIIPNLLIAPYENFLAYLNNSKKFYDFLITEKLKSIFTFTVSKNKKLPSFRITYTFSYQKEIFNVTVTGTDGADMVIESTFMEKLLSEWKEAIQKKDSDSHGILTPDGFKEKKLTFYNDLLKKFGGYFPMATTFVPASRAALAFSSSHTDYHLNGFKELVDFLPRFHSKNHEIQEIIEAILKAKMRFERGALFLESDDGRKVHISKASSGQQEIVYVLMMLDKLGNFSYSYGKHHSVFIEEPSAHLFPLEQKQTIELIVRIFNYLKGNGNPVRFFITTHSPYVLNTLNNILTKGALLDKYKDQEDRINNSFDIPYLKADEISAFFINNDGSYDNMLDMDEKYMFADKIAQISIEIDKVTAELSQFKNKLHGEKELLD
jgi:predicted ATPase